MPEVPTYCTKCHGLVMWEDEDTFRCAICSKRFYFFQVTLRIIPNMKRETQRAERNKVAHAFYMRYYMRMYRKRKRGGAP